uniref:FecR family protein n=1 Tax=Pedobacter schmidteae TaxID=2201271 RepID=UPI001D02668A|nr:FecR family protein [Pedobacter schmidteae]
MMTEKEFRELLIRYRNGQASEQEQAMLESRYLRWNEEGKPLHSVELLTEVDAEMWSALKERLQLGEPQINRRRSIWPKVASAAAVLLVVAAAFFYFNQQKKDGHTLQAGVNDVAPGKQGATLMLSNGERIKLTDVSSGELAREAGVAIRKSPDGQLIYELLQQDQGKRERNEMNTLSTAKGETYKLRLPDGSLVWLNAASSLTYAAGLNRHGKRSVKLEGEAYFEIAKDKAHPFVVESRGQEIEVLGTHFNVSSYAYEANVKTTLLEGSVQITPLQNPEKKVVLKPGEQAVATREFLILPVDVEVATAWKNGNFYFKEEPLETILYRLAYWYDVEFVYQGKKPKMIMSGIIKRSTKLSNVLELIESTGKVKFQIEGRKVFVMN